MYILEHNLIVSMPVYCIIIMADPQSQWSTNTQAHLDSHNTRS